MIPIIQKKDQESLLTERTIDVLYSMLIVLYFTNEHKKTCWQTLSTRSIMKGIGKSTADAYAMP